MNKINTFTALALAAALIGTTTACGSDANTNATVTQQSNSAIVTNTNSAAAAEPLAALETSVTDDSPTDTYKAAYKARKEKDIEMLKGMLSKDILEFLKEMGEAEDKSVEDGLRELAEKPQAKTAEARNEKIEGNTATIEYLDENGKWRPMDFIKEDGKWKLTIGKGDAESMDQPASKK